MKDITFNKFQAGDRRTKRQRLEDFSNFLNNVGQFKAEISAQGYPEGISLCLGGYKLEFPIGSDIASVRELAETLNLAIKEGVKPWIEAAKKEGVELFESLA